MSIAQRTSRFTRTGPAPHAVPPALRRVAAAGLAAAAVSLAADLVLVAVGRAGIHRSRVVRQVRLRHLRPADRPGGGRGHRRLGDGDQAELPAEWLLTRLAALVTALFGIPDFLLLGTPGNPAGPVVILMLMHLAIAAITYVALLTIAPARGGAR